MEGDYLSTAGGTTEDDFNPLPPYGGRHTLVPNEKAEIVFQSTPSVWRETITEPQTAKMLTISIHSLRMEGDQMWL